MKDKKDNAYQVKLKLIPKGAGFKSSFVQGIVFESSPAQAEKRAITEIKKWVQASEYEAEIKLQSILKIRKDFLFFPPVTKKEDQL